MKTLYESLLDDFDTLNDKIDPREEIKRFLEENYKSSDTFEISVEPNKNGYYVVTSKRRTVKAMKQIKQLTNELFVFENIFDFNCSRCHNLTSLKGAPKAIKGDFYCYHCKNLKSLEGAPRLINTTIGDFDCCGCEKLTSLKGAPEVVGFFCCRDCENLTSLEGAPKKIIFDFDCEECEKLTSLKGAPKEVGRDFYSRGNTFTEEDIRKVSNIKGNVIIQSKL